MNFEPNEKTFRNKNILKKFIRIKKGNSFQFILIFLMLYVRKFLFNHPKSSANVEYFYKNIYKIHEFGTI